MPSHRSEDYAHQTIILQCCLWICCNAVNQNVHLVYYYSKQSSALQLHVHTIHITPSFTKDANFSADDSRMLKEAVNAIKVDAGFSKLESPQALSTASKFLEWADDPCHQATLRAFARQLVEALKKCVLNKCPRNLRTQREKMWNSFHTLRVSDPFQKLARFS